MFEKLFKKPDPRITAYKSALEANSKDRAAIAAWLDEQTERETALANKLAKYAIDPWDSKLGQEIVDLGARISAEKEVRGRLAVAGHAQLEHKVLNRLRPKAIAACDALLEGLRSELATVEARDAAEAARYDLPPTKGAIAIQLTQAIDKISGFQKLFEKMDATNIAVSMAQILN